MEWQGGRFIGWLSEVPHVVAYGKGGKTVGHQPSGPAATHLQGRNPFGVEILLCSPARVARSSQPRAECRNPFGIGLKGKCYKHVAPTGAGLTRLRLEEAWKSRTRMRTRKRKKGGKTVLLETNQ